MIFLGGLPRSGNTVLSGILNQNPSIYCSPLSPLRDVLVALHSQRGNFVETIRSESMGERYFSNLATYAYSFHNNQEKAIVIDRNKLWGDQHSLPLMNMFFGPSPKLIFTIRNVEDIVRSFLKLKYPNGQRYPDLFINQIGGFDNFKLGNKTKDDIRVDWLLEEGKLLDLSLRALTNIIKNNVNVHLIDYNDLVNDKELVINNLHNFLEIEDYNYDYNNVNVIEDANDILLGYPTNLHAIRPQLQLENNDIKLSDYAIKRCNLLQFWKS